MILPKIGQKTAALKLPFYATNLTYTYSKELINEDKKHSIPVLHDYDDEPFFVYDRS